MTEDVERNLISRYQAGDQGAYGELFEAHHPRVLNLAVQMMRNEESALDVCQEVFLRAYEELHQWRGEARFSTWLYRAVLNVCYERIRAEEKQRRLRDRAPALDMMPSPEGHVLTDETLALIDRAIQELPARQRLIFILKQYEEKRFAEIAEQLQITEGGAKASYHKALLALRVHLRDLAPDASRPAET
jgi:RNA polymerase sigma-70 factor, ECF subfamily